MSDKRKILRITGILGFFTLISRFTGLARDIMIAAMLGGSRVSDVFWFAFEGPNLARRVLGEGAISSFIVPLFGARRAESADAGWSFVNRAVNIIGLISLVLTLAGMLFSGLIFNLIGGFGILAHARGGGPAELEAATGAVVLGADLTRVMFPYLLGLAVASIMMGVCHGLGSFVAPAFGSIVLNIAMIAAGGAAVYLSAGPEHAAWLLAWSVLWGALLRIIIMIPPMVRGGWRWRPELTTRDPEIRQLFGMMGTGLFALSVSQINIIIVGLLAGYLGPGNKAYLVYAHRMIQFPMGLTATAMATAMLPRLADLTLAGRREELGEVLRFTKRIELVFILPATVGLMIFGPALIEVLFERGEWTAATTEGAARALLFVAPGLVPLGWVRLILPVYYARRDVLTPARAAFVSLVVNAAAGAGFAFFTDFGVAGLAVASSLGAFANYLALAWWMKRDPGLPDPDVEWSTLFKCLAASVASVGGAWILRERAMAGFAGEAGDAFLLRTVSLALAVTFSAVAYFILIHALRVPDSRRAIEMIRAKLLSRARGEGKEPRTNGRSQD